MTPERWARLKDVLAAALSRPAADRGSFLDAACGDDTALRDEVADLLDCHDEMGDFLEEPLVPDVRRGKEDEIPPDLKQWTRYTITDTLGTGGMAVVYKAWDPRLQRSVALKAMNGRDELTVKRFLREAEAQARVDHEHVLKIYETGVVGQQHYIAMQYVDGPTLIGVREETSIECKVALMLKIAEGLHAAHRHGLIHRDIKPGNILVERGSDGLKPFLLDFGLAVELGAPALTMSGVVVGTPRYMAPERIHGGASAVDRRSDIYSLGATFYEFLSGTTPFAESSGFKVLVDVLESDFRPLRALDPAVPPELEAIVAKCLEKDPQRRYQSARALADDLRRYLAGEPVLARPEGTMARLARRVRRHPRSAAAIAALAAVVLIVGGWGAYGYWRAARQAELAQTLGQDVRDLEWLYRAAQMSPLHPIEPERRQVRERMARLEGMLDEMGALASGPVNYALGRGYLTLGDTAKALEHLQVAWDAGYRTADAALALGLAHGEIFRIESTRARRIAGDAERAARIRQLETAHRDRAVDFLGDGRSSAIVPARFVEALMASHRGDVDGAIGSAGEAARETPWLFEARLLQGHLQFTDAVKRYFMGDVRQAALKAGEADRYYTEAQRVAASAVDAYVGRCAVAGLVLHMAHHGLAADPLPPYRQADAACAQALVIDPANAEAYRLFGEAVRFWANGKVQHGEDPGGEYERSAGLTRRAMELSRGDLESLIALADTFLDQAWWEDKQDRDPRPALGRAVATYEQALAADARNVTAANNMGQALLLGSRFEAAHGIDPSASQDRTIDSFQRALRVDPTLSFAWRNLARAAIERADAQARRGLDPSRGLGDVVRFIEELPGDPALPVRAEAMVRLRAREEVRSASRR